VYTKHSYRPFFVLMPWINKKAVLSQGNRAMPL